MRMPINIGTRLGSYEITAMLGKGGMGEVYRAHDRRLERDVAVKVLPEAFVNDPDRLARFEREARALAALNHPGIGVIHDIQEHGGTRFLVLELIEGESLRDRLDRGPIPVPEALELLKQVAAALEAAHEKGIFHRDLKPANIQLTPDGRAKVLDFGLAKVAEREAASSSLSNSPTLAPGRTTGGMILGTAAYMSPEQARGRTVDKRTDVFAFGCVLYEALSGRPSFDGETVTDIMASVVKADPDWSLLPANLPSAARALLRQCLHKDPRHRLQDIGDARVAIEDALAEPLAPAIPVAPMPTATRSRFAIVAAVAFLLAGALLGWLLTGLRVAPADITHFELSVAPADQLYGSYTIRPSRTAFAMSPDGKTVVFSGRRPRASQAQLFVRSFTGSEATPLAGTEDGVGPFFSPDGQWIAFFAKGQLKKVALAGGPPAVICDVENTAGLFGGSWSQEGTIFFSATGDGISRVPAAGGSSEVVTTSNAAKGERHLLPEPLPGGKAIVFTVQTANNWDKAQVVVRSLDSGSQQVLIDGAADARYLPSGHLVYMRLGTLMAVPFDANSLQLAGDPVAMLENVMQSVGMPNSGDETGAGQFVVSESGALLYVRGGLHPQEGTSVVSTNREGDEDAIRSVPVQAYLSPRFSPDENKFVVLVRSGVGRNEDAWVYDISRGTPTRLTFGGSNWPALWSPDGKRIVFNSNESGVKNLYLVNADGSGKPERLTNSEYEQRPSSWIAEGNLIAFLEYHLPSSQIWVLPMEGERKPRLFLDSRFFLSYPELSPNAQWMAFVSNESGENEVYVQPFPNGGDKYRISTEGGSEPIWLANSRELVYRDGDKFFSVAITSVNPFRADPPRFLFSDNYRNDGPVRGWDMSRDGKRFLLLRPQGSNVGPVTQVNVVRGWTEEVRRRVPRK